MKIVTLVEDKNRERILLMFYNYLDLSTTKLNLLLGKITGKKHTCFPRYRRPRATGGRSIMDSATSASLRSIKTNMIDCTTISSLQTTTNSNPREMAVKTKTSRGVWESARIVESSA
jgi:hypothetical protein